MMAKVAPWKKGRVSELAELLSNDGIVGIVDIGGVPAGNMLGMRNSLRDRMTMTMAKKTLRHRHIKYVVEHRPSALLIRTNKILPLIPPLKGTLKIK